MKFNVTVDLDDFYDEEGEGASFSQQIKDHIAWQIKSKVLEDFKLKTGDEFNRIVVERINE